MLMPDSCFIRFKRKIKSIKKPLKFTYPFYYEPNELSKIASLELQEHLNENHNWTHNFGLSKDEENPTGKMFGVLVVENESNEIGYLAAFSGKIAGVNLLDNFVPPVYDMLNNEGFFMKGQEEITKINKRVRELELDPKIKAIEKELKIKETQFENEIKIQKDQNIELKKLRKNKRDKAAVDLSTEDYVKVNETLSKESILQKNRLRDLRVDWRNKIAKIKAKQNELTLELRLLREKRKTLSVKLQNRLFDEYHFINTEGIKRSLRSIFEETPQGIPPSAAGECAAPKLLQYAFLNKLKPITMAEFWWGAEPKSAIRKHKHFYPSCQGKCFPILNHMLTGLAVDENPLLKNLAKEKEIEIVYEDDVLVVLNKPSDLLSVPGKNIKDCVLNRMITRYPNASGPLIVHRLDMATSGIMLIAKTKEAHDHLQKQFINRTITKRYTAILDGVIDQSSGIIDLPLRVDLDDRPRQLVCYKNGKSSRTRFEVVGIEDEKTRIHFYPITGRTHQLRVHASHFKGLNTPIIGDDLYGIKDTRLKLHAAYIAFKHPVTNKLVRYNATENF
ncbi:MAG: RluA family pseudouridine synthase [Flavobacteriales bacterium]|nr:RluA family pseudouridine synthase [Flavobacteriales bacterium]